MFCDAIIESREDNDLLTGSDHVFDTLSDRFMFGFMQRNPNLREPCKELRIIWCGWVGPLIPVKKTFYCRKGGRCIREVDRHPGADLGGQVDNLILFAPDHDLFH